MQEVKTPLSTMEFGEKIDTNDAISVNWLVSSMIGKAEAECLLRGKIVEVCQTEGCWLNIENTSGEPLLVRMKDHSFNVPKDIAGRTVFIQGLAKTDVTSIELLKDYANDAGKSEAEIQAIKEPKTQIVVEAKGIYLLPSDDAGKK